MARREAIFFSEMLSFYRFLYDLTVFSGPGLVRGRAASAPIDHSIIIVAANVAGSVDHRTTARTGGRPTGGAQGQGRRAPRTATAEPREHGPPSCAESAAAEKRRRRARRR